MSDKYTRPLCTCGGELFMVCEVVYEEKQKINSDGSISLVTQKHKDHVGTTGCEWLECEDCGHNFNIDFNKNNKVTRGASR